MTPMARADAPGDQALRRKGRKVAGKLGRPPERSEVNGLHERGSSQLRPRGGAGARYLEPACGRLPGKEP
jgi:hypothetical protein